MKMTYTFDDIGLTQREKTTIASRADVDLSVKINSTDYKVKTVLKVPIVSSPMDTVTGDKMALAMNSIGGVGIIHRIQSIESQVMQLKRCFQHTIGCQESQVNNFGVAIGVNGDWKERLDSIFSLYKDYRPDIRHHTTLWICFDTANGFTSMMEEALKYFHSKEYSNEMVLMTGNVLSAEGYEFLVKMKSDIVRIGVGGGSACTTSVVTGVGVGTISILEEIQNGNVSEEHLMVDGGIRHSSDAVKAFAFGSRLVMLGRMLSGFDESEGETITDVNTGRKVKAYRGLSSKGVLNTINYVNGIEKTRTAEGIETYVDYKGSVNDFLNEFVMGISSAFTYFNSKNFEEFREYFEAYPDAITLLSGASQTERKPKF